MSIHRLIIGLSVLLSAGLLAYALSAAEPKPAADGLEEKEETFDYTIEGETKHGKRKVVTLDLGGGVTMEFVRIAHGTFLMGSPESDMDPFEHDEMPQHEAEITKDFYLGKYLVTKGQFARFVEAAKYQTEAEADGKGGWGFEGGSFTQDPKYTWRDPGFSQADDHPVVQVSWNDAVEFCKWISGATKRRIVLPTEAQSEYTCRAGTTTRYFTGDKAESLEGSANVRDRSFKKQFPNSLMGDFDDGYVFTSPVGKFRPNAFGLYDMTGNVWEWCADYYDPEYYHRSDKKDPVNLDKSAARVKRGGAWDFLPVYCRAARRGMCRPTYRYSIVGFRVALCLD